jgi:hypothetical protein
MTVKEASEVLAFNLISYHTEDKNLIVIDRDSRRHLLRDPNCGVGLTEQAVEALLVLLRAQKEVAS